MSFWILFCILFWSYQISSLALVLLALYHGANFSIDCDLNMTVCLINTATSSSSSVSASPSVISILDSASVRYSYPFASASYNGPLVSTFAYVFAHVCNIVSFWCVFGVCVYLITYRSPSHDHNLGCVPEHLSTIHNSSSR